MTLTIETINEVADQLISEYEFKSKTILPVTSMCNLEAVDSLRRFIQVLKDKYHLNLKNI